MSLVSAMKRNLTTKINSGLALSWVRSGGLSQVRNMAHKSDTHLIVKEYLDMGGGRSVVYRKLFAKKNADKKPTIVMVPGLVSHVNMDEEGKKAGTIFNYCDHYDYSCVLYDSEWQSSDKAASSDALTVIDKLTDGPVVLVGSGVGCWLSLITAQAMPAEKLHGLVLISPRSPLPHRYYEHSYLDLGVKKDLVEDSVRHEIDENQMINIGCPVRIISSLRDKETIPEHLIELAASLKTKDVDLIYRKGSDHMLKNIYDLELVLLTVDRMLMTYSVGQTSTDLEIKAE